MQCRFAECIARIRKRYKLIGADFTENFHRDRGIYEETKFNERYTLRLNIKFKWLLPTMCVCVRLGGGGGWGELFAPR